MPKTLQEFIDRACAASGYAIAIVMPVAVVILIIGFARMIGKAVFQ